MGSADHRTRTSCTRGPCRNGQNTVEAPDGHRTTITCDLIEPYGAPERYDYQYSPVGHPQRAVSSRCSMSWRPCLAGPGSAVAAMVAARPSSVAAEYVA